MPSVVRLIRDCRAEPAGFVGILLFGGLFRTAGNVVRPGAARVARPDYRFSTGVVAPRKDEGIRFFGPCRKWTRAIGPENAADRTTTEDAKPAELGCRAGRKAGEMADPMEMQSKAAAIAEAQTSKHVLDIVEAQLRRLGATHILVTGLPMPNRPINGLVHRFRWADDRAGGIERAEIDADDSALMLGLMRNRAFVWEVTAGETAHSELFASLGADTRVVVVPVTEAHPFQALVLGGGEHLEAGSVELSNLELICNAAFRRLIELGVLSTQRPGDLSARERRVLELTALGKTASDIAGLLEISQRTVHAHLQNASAKLNASNKTHTVVEALRYGQIRL